MKSCHEMEEALNDHVDELLSPREQREVDRHLASCGPCRETVRALEALRERAAALPDDVEPPRDLWPGIRAAVLLDRESARRPAPFRRFLPAAAAAVVLVIGTAWVTVKLTGTPGGQAVGAQAPGLETFRAVEADYRAATTDLLATFESRRDELSPETVAVVEENLGIIDRAIQEAWAALENDPSQLENGRYFNRLYREKVELLQQAVGLPAEG